MGIFKETKEEVLAKAIAHAPRLSNESVLSPAQKELDFDDQVLSSLGPEQESLRNAITTCSQSLVDQSESAIKLSANPTHVDQLLRISFWEEISDALMEGRQISERAIYNGICSFSYWRAIRDEAAEKFTYLLIPVKSYQRTNKLVLALGQERLIDILNADPYVKSAGSGYKKQLDPKIAKVQLEAYKMVEERLFGKAVNRIQTHNTNESRDAASETIEQLKREIIELENNTPILIDGDVE